MKILWLNWKDIQHPLAGGAEVVLHEISKRLVAEGHEVTILTALYAGASKEDCIDGIKIIRIGNNKYIHSFLALYYFIRHLRGKYDLVVEVVNTAPYFSPFFEKKAKTILFYHQLAREIWFYETSFPLNYFGYYLLEPIATFLLGKSDADVITISNSTKQDLIKFGFDGNQISIISEGIEFKPIDHIGAIKKYSEPTVLSLGAIRAMKRTDHQVRAFEIAKQYIPNLQLKIAGNATGEYAQKVLKTIQDSPFRDSIEYMGRVSQQQKIELMQKVHAILVTSIKEGWGLIVTEAASQGTPALVYDVDGLRDSVKNKKTGLITEKNTPEDLASNIVAFFNNQQTSVTMSSDAVAFSKEITFERSYQQFKEVVKIS